MAELIDENGDPIGDDRPTKEEAILDELDDAESTMEEIAIWASVVIALGNPDANVRPKALSLIGEIIEARVHDLQRIVTALVQDALVEPDADNDGGSNG